MATATKAMAAGLAGAPNDSSKRKAPKMKVCEITIRRGAEGGFIAKHRMEPEREGKAECYGYFTENKEYPIQTLDELQKHIAKHLPEMSTHNEGNETQSAEG